MKGVYDHGRKKGPGMIDGSADKIYDIFHEGWTELR